MILKTAANMQEHGYIETGKEGGYYEVGGQRTEIGGGSSDFSTANVTVNVEGFTSDMPAYAMRAACIDPDDIITFSIGLPPTENMYKVILYKGVQELQLNAGSNGIPIASVTGSGDVTIDKFSGDYVIKVKGDCSITITYSGSTK